MIIPFLKHITKIQNQRGDVKFFVVFFRQKREKDASFRVFHQPLHRRHILSYLRKAGVVGEVHISGFAVAVLGKNQHTEAFRGVTAFALRGQVVDGRAIEQ